ncbi:hypothetical protein [Actinosynnema sp. NPDC023587]|uniref:hypothetical protein n=1 Tax=Actinosynnema sp. NPDC023587 TaxID=3154695 RepID=UPI0033F7F290
MAWLPLVLVGLLCGIWEHGSLAGVVVLLVAAGWMRDRRLVAADAVLVVAVVYGSPPLPAVVAGTAALLLAAHDLHARRPGLWFPLLTTGLGVFLVWLGGLWLVDEPLRAWAPVVPATGESTMSSVAYEDHVPPVDLTWIPVAVLAVLCGGAAIAFARDREWVPLAVVGPLSAVWEYGPLVGIAVLTVVAGFRRDPRLVAATAAFGVAALVDRQPFPAVVALAAALLIAAHDRHARRPGGWFPLLALGLGVAVATFDTASLRTPSPPMDYEVHSTELSSHAMSAATSLALEMSAEIHAARVLAAVIAVGLALWAWRSRDLLVTVTAAAYWARPGTCRGTRSWWSWRVRWSRSPATTAPGRPRRAGRWAGRPARRPVP